MFGSSLHPVACRRVHVLFMFFVVVFACILLYFIMYCQYLYNWIGNKLLQVTSASLRIVVSNLYCVGFFFVSLRLVSCFPYVASFSGFSIFHCSFGIL
jgi:hypothetical protein